MSGRGGRGGRGRGGGQRGGKINSNSVPWAMDPSISIELTGKPGELFPEYDVPVPAPLKKKEEKQTETFLLFREQCQSSPLYTKGRTWTESGRRGRTYGQDQNNKRYAQASSKATIDPFTAVPRYSQLFQRPERTLPDFSNRPYTEFFPPELRKTLEGEDYPAGDPAFKRRRTEGDKKLVLTNVTNLKTAEDLFQNDEEQQDGYEEEDEDVEDGADGEKGHDYGKAMELLNNLHKRMEEGDENVGLLPGEDEDDDWIREAQEDDEGNVIQDDPDEYDDESGDDYNAEQYFDDGDADDFGDDGDAGGAVFD